MDEDTTRTCLGIVLAVIIGGLMWVGLFGIFKLLSSVTLETGARTASGALLLVGSWLVVRACVELDR